MDLRKLQRLVVDALEDIKAQDIKVFNTTELTSLFDRMIVATASSGRQTRSLAAHVRDRARAAGVREITLTEHSVPSGVLGLADLCSSSASPRARRMRLAGGVLPGVSTRLLA